MAEFVGTSQPSSLVSYRIIVMERNFRFNTRMWVIARPKQHMWVAVFVLTVCLAAVVRSSPPVSFPRTQHTTLKPVVAYSDQSLWRVNLQPLGYPADNLHELQWRRGLDEFDTVDFVSERGVVATFVTQESVSEPQRRDDPNRARPYRLHAIFLDASTGKVLKTLEWPTDDPNTGIFPRYDGSFLFFSTERIVLYSADWKPVKELPLPQLQAPHSYLAGIAESPSGKVLVVRFRQNQSIGCIRIITATLDGSEDACEIPGMFTVSDEETAMRDGPIEKPENTHFGPIVRSTPLQESSPGPLPRPIQGPPVGADFIPTISIQASGESRRRLCDSRNVTGCDMPQFISNDMLVVYENFVFAIMNHKGENEFEIHFPPGTQTQNEIDPMGRPVRPSANGKRFAVVFNFQQGHPGESIRTLELPGDLPGTSPVRVDVYDVDAEAAVYKLLNRKNLFKQIWGLGLSPSGEKLVIDSGGMIQMYKLPPTSESTARDH